MEIKTPDDIVGLLQSLTLSDARRKNLHRNLANKTRRFFRDQIKQQRDIHGIPYAPRRRRKPIAIGFGGEKIYKQNLDQGRNMLTGFSRAIKTQVDNNGFSVGLQGIPRQIAQTHNEGKKVTFSTRVNGWFNSKNNRWEGGRKAHFSYKMPKRTSIGWTPKLEQEIVHDILKEMEPQP